MVNCPICDFEIQEEDSKECPECGYNFLEPAEDQYVEAIEKISKLSALMGDGTKLSEEDLKLAYKGIVDSLKQVFDDSSHNFADSMKAALLIRGLTEDSDFYKDIAKDFDKIGDRMTEAVNKLGAAFSVMRELDDPKEMDHARLMLEESVSEIEDALEDIMNMEDSLMDTENTAPPPIDISAPADIIGEASGLLERYLATYNVDELKKCVECLGTAEDYLVSYIAQYDPKYIDDLEGGDSEYSGNEEPAPETHFSHFEGSSEEPIAEIPHEEDAVNDIQERFDFSENSSGFSSLQVDSDKNSLLENPPPLA